MNGTLSFVAMSMGQDEIIVSEIRQAVTDKSYIISLICKSCNTLLLELGRGIVVIRD
jgi:hypothetical protein